MMGNQPRRRNVRTVMKSALALFVLVVMLAAACGSSSEAPAPGAGGDDGSAADVLGQWELERGTLDGSAFPLVEGYRVTFQLEADGSFSGRAACNGYGGTASLDGASLDIAEWFITEMGCEPAVTASEQAFISVLQRSLTLDREGDLLLMTGDGVDLQFSLVPPVPTSELVGTTWQLHSLFEGQAASSILGDATLRLDEDGTFVGSTGCRELTGTYVIAGDEIGITQMSADGECVPDLVRQDGFVIGVLESPRVEIEADQLRLWTSGDEGLGYRAAGAGS